MPFTQWLAEEAAQAGDVKANLPIMVILGNPPYSKASYNRSSWITRLLEDYKKTVRNTESQIQGLSNDYIKFIRFAQWKLDQTGAGIMAFITGHGYITGPQAKDMRASLLKSFNKLYILNLHGSIRRENRLTSQISDEPVFQIQQGTAIIIGVKNGSKESEVHYSDLVGSLDGKFAFLSEKDVQSTEWKKIDVTEPDYFFSREPEKSSDNKLQVEYSSFQEFPEIFGTGNRDADKENRWSTGFSSQQDEFAISFTEKEIARKVAKLIESKSEEDARSMFRLCSTNQWSYKRAREELKSNLWRDKVALCDYRPFDTRYTAFDRNIVTILRKKVISQIKGSNNISFVVSRVINDPDFCHVFVCERPVDKIFLSNKTSTNAYVFPLYLDENDEQNGLFDEHSHRIANLSPAFLVKFSKNVNLTYVESEPGDLKKTFGTRDIFHYAYAVLFSPAYRVRYEKFLKTDFPRLPLTSKKQQFSKLCVLGNQLVALHLMQTHGPQLCSYPVVGNNRVDKVRFVADPANTGQPNSAGRVYINAEQYFEGVPSSVWNYLIGGYQVANKWLKDRKGRLLTFDELLHYQRIVSALAETIRLQAEIDAAIPVWPMQ